MRVEVRMTNEDTFTIVDMPDEDILDLTRDLEEGTSQTITLAMDQARPATVHLTRAHISSVVID